LIFFDGDLGAGKTTLCRGILQAFGHWGTVKSPTYTLVETYELGNDQVHHFDLYRLGDPEELEFMGIRDYFQPGNFCLIEWPNRGAGILPIPDLRVDITLTNNGRIITIVAETLVGETILSHMSHHLERSRQRD
jgi:tRNA threonylcarbamoyladenosine biosynthesis protein TsaE